MLRPVSDPDVPDGPPESVPLVDVEPVHGTGPFSVPPGRREPPRDDALAVRPGSDGLAIYSVATGLVAALPVPFLDQWLTPAVRGSALRKVALRHGVRLTPEAREVLASAGGGDVRRRIEGRIARELFRQLLRPLRLATRFEDAIYTMAASILFDHYLRHRERPADQPVGRAEAARIRRAIEAAMVDGVWAGLRSGPDGVLRTVQAAAGDVFRVDAEEGRTPVERLVDALLDGVADAPRGLFDRLTDAFDAAWARAAADA